MVANVHTLVTRNFATYPIDGYNLSSMNIYIERMEKIVNIILAKIRKKGYFMDDIQLQKIDNITQVEKVLNENIDKINTYLMSLNDTLGQNYMLSKEILETMKIDVLNDDSSSTIVVFNDRIDVELNNGQVVSVQTDKVTSVKDGDTKVITHG